MNELIIQLESTISNYYHSQTTIVQHHLQELKSSYDTLSLLEKKTRKFYLFKIFLLMIVPKSFSENHISSG